MKKTILLLLLVTCSHLCNSQTLERAEYLRKLRKEDNKNMEETFEKLSPDSSKDVFYKIEIAELTNKSLLNSGWDGWATFIYSGDIIKGVLQLFKNYPYSRLRVKGKMPEKHISFCGFRPPNWESFATQTTALGNNGLLDSITEPVNKMIFDILREKYKFSVSNIEDTCEVWTVKVVDENKLSNAVTKNNVTGVGGGEVIKKDGKVFYNIDYIGLHALWTNIEPISKHIIYDETHDYRKFTIELEMSILSDFDKLNIAFEPYGLRLFKEKRLEKLKLIEFHE